MRTRPIAGSLLRYRVIAYVTGVLINLLYFVGIPLQVFADSDGVVHVVGALHGGFFIVYLITILDLAFRCRWPFLRMIGVMLAGLLPVMTFVAEHQVVIHVRDGSWAPPSAPVEAS